MSYENVTVVTEPDIYMADQPAILLVGCDLWLDTVVDNMRRLNTPVTVYTTTDNTLQWLSTAYVASDITVLDCEFNSLFTGFFIDKQRVYYYNNKESYKRFNLNEVADPMEPLIKWMTKWQDNQEKNAVYL